MKHIHYLLQDGKIEKNILCSDTLLESNLALAQKEAFEGSITVTEDETVYSPLSQPQDDVDAMLIDHEYRLTLLELDLSESEVNETCSTAL